MKKFLLLTTVILLSFAACSEINEPESEIPEITEQSAGVTSKTAIDSTQISAIPQTPNIVTITTPAEIVELEPVIIARTPAVTQPAATAIRRQNIAATVSEQDSIATQPARTARSSQATTDTQPPVTTVTSRNSGDSKVCPDDPGNSPIPTLNKEREERILIDFAKEVNKSNKFSSHIFTADDFSVINYFGTFNGNDVVVVFGNNWAGTADMQYIMIEGYLVAELGSGSLPLMVYDGEKFTHIREAYEQGLLKYDDLRTMAFRRLRLFYARQLNGYSWGNLGESARIARANNVMILNYYGHSSHGEIVTFGLRNRTISNTAKTIEVAGYRFTLPSSCMDILIRWNWFECISTAYYEKGAVSKRAISELYAKYFNKDYELAGEIKSNGEFRYRHNNKINGIEIMGFCGESSDLSRYWDSHLSITIPEKINGIPVKGIGESAFSSMSAFKSVGITLPNGLTHIENRAFEWINLTDMTLPDSVVYAGLMSFRSNEGLTVTYLGVSYSAVTDRYPNVDLPQEFYNAVNKSR
jgi:hypothetical protein